MHHGCTRDLSLIILQTTLGATCFAIIFAQHRTVNVSRSNLIPRRLVGSPSNASAADSALNDASYRGVVKQPRLTGSLSDLSLNNHTNDPFHHLGRIMKENNITDKRLASVIGILSRSDGPFRHGDLPSPDPYKYYRRENNSEPHSYFNQTSRNETPYYQYGNDTEDPAPLNSCLYCNQSGYLEVDLNHKPWDLGFICSEGFPNRHPPTTPCVVLFKQPVTLLFHEFYVEFQYKVSVCDQQSRGGAGFDCSARGRTIEKDPRKEFLWTLSANQLLNLTMTEGQRESDGWMGVRKGFNITFEADPDSPFNITGLRETTPFSCHDSGYPVIRRLGPRNVTSECQCLDGSSGDACQYGATCTFATRTSYCSGRGLCSERQRGKFVLCHCIAFNSSIPHGPTLDPPLYHLHYYGGSRCELPHTAFNFQDYSAECRRKGVCPHQCHLLSDPEQPIRVYCSQPPDIVPRTCSPGNHSSERHWRQEAVGPAAVSSGCGSSPASDNTTTAFDPSDLVVGPVSWRDSGLNQLVVLCPVFPCRQGYHFRWFQDGVLIPTFNHSASWYTTKADECTSELYIDQPEPHVYGLYECEVEHCSQHVRRGVFVDPRPPTVIILPQEIAVREGGNTTLRCVGLNKPRLWVSDFNIVWLPPDEPNLATISPGDDLPRWQEYLEPIDLPHDGPWQWQWKEKALQLQDIWYNLTLHCIINSFDAKEVTPHETSCQPKPKSFNASVSMDLAVEGSSSITIRVLGPGVLACEEEGREALGTFWPLTEAGGEAVQRCPLAFVGYATRKCVRFDRSEELQSQTAGNLRILSMPTHDSMTYGTTADHAAPLKTTVPSSARAVWEAADYSGCLQQSLLETFKIIRRVETVFLSFSSCEQKISVIRVLATPSGVTALPGSCERLLDLFYRVLLLPVTSSELKSCDWGPDSLRAVSRLAKPPTCVKKSLDQLQKVFKLVHDNWKQRLERTSSQEHFSAFTLGAIGNSSFSVTSGTGRHLDNDKTNINIQVSVHPAETLQAGTSSRIMAIVTIFKTINLLPIDITWSLGGLVGNVSFVQLLPGPRLTVQLQVKVTEELNNRKQAATLVCRRTAMSGLDWTENGCTKHTSGTQISSGRPNKTVSSITESVLITGISRSPSRVKSVVCECEEGGYIGVFEVEPTRDGRAAFQQPVLPSPERWFADALVCTSCALSAALLLLVMLTVHCCRHTLDPLGLASAAAFVVVFLSFAVAAGIDSPEFVVHVAGLLLAAGLSTLQQLQMSSVMQVPAPPPHMAPTSHASLPVTVKIASAVLIGFVMLSCTALLLLSKVRLPSSFPYWLPRDTALQVVILAMLMATSLHWFYQLVANGVAMMRLDGKQERAELLLRLRGVLRRSAVLLASLWLFVLSSFAQFGPVGRFVFAGSAVWLSVVRVSGVCFDQMEVLCLSSTRSIGQHGPCTLWVRNLFSKMAVKFQRSPTYIDAPLTEVTTSLPLDVTRQKRNSVTSSSSTCPPPETDMAFDQNLDQSKAASTGMDIIRDTSMNSYPQRRRYSTGASLDHLYEELEIVPAGPPPPLFPRRPLANRNRSHLELRSQTFDNDYEVMKIRYENSGTLATVRTGVASVVYEHWGKLLTRSLFGLNNSHINQNIFPAQTVAKTAGFGERSEEDDVYNIYATIQYTTIAQSRYLPMRTPNNGHANN